MKKYLYFALALPLLYACSSEDFDEKIVSNDPFPGIEKVDATFSMDEQTTRFDGGVWTTEEGDLWGFAWMTDDHTETPAYTKKITADGKAYQNHNLIQTSVGTTSIFKPQTSIYVGQYYIYRPYDETTVSPQAINFNSLVDQPLAEGYASSTQAWKDLAKTAINIGDKWTEITPTGHTYGTDPTVWDLPGTQKPYKIYAALFSNQTGLDLTYKKNNVAFDGKNIKGARDIDYTYPTGSTIGAADIYKAEVTLAGAAKSFTYAPTAEPNGGAHDGEYWADKSGAIGGGVEGTDGFTFIAGAITLNGPAKGISTDVAGNKAWFWFNSLPVSNGGAINTTNVTTVFNTSYGIVTVSKALKDCAYAFEYPAGASSKEWIQLAATTDETASPKKWDPAAKNTFVNQYGNHKGKYTFDVDFSTGVMNNMHIKDDAHLQKALKYYIASGKPETGVVLNLDADADNEFKISKISIALLQTINNTVINNVLVQACGTHGTPKIVVTQDGQAGITGLDGKTEVPDLNKVFAVATDVYLSKNYTWKWTGGADNITALTIDNKVSSITNEGTLEVDAKNVQLSVAASTLGNAKKATMKIKQVTTVKNALTNLGTIEVGAADNTAAELRAYGVEIKNDAEAKPTIYGGDDNKIGKIYNYGVVGVSAGTGGSFNNYGYIYMLDGDAITLLSSNEKNANAPAAGPFKTPFVAGTNMMGTVVLPPNKPYALVSVANTDETGFIKYNWTASEYKHDTNNVKYNTIVVNSNITFTGADASCTEIKYVEFDGKKIQVVNPTGHSKITSLKGVIINDGSSIIIEKSNELVCSDGAYLGDGATVYKGGTFTFVSVNNYYGNWTEATQIVEY